MVFAMKQAQAPGIMKTKRQQEGDLVANELEQEFMKTIEEVTKDVTESVVKDSALKAVNDLNKTLQTLKKDSKDLVTDIRQAKGMYHDVAAHSQQSLQHFSEHLDTWQGQQEQLLKAIDSRNRGLLNRIEAIEKKQEQHDNALRQGFRTLQQTQETQQRLEREQTSLVDRQFKETQATLQAAKSVLQSDQVGQTIFLKKKMQRLWYLLWFNSCLFVVTMIYLFRNVIFSLIGG